MKEKFLNWQEYAQMIAQRDHILFVNDTANRSINNYWNKKQNRRQE